ncbi:reverse transcriptase domain-containing protein [Tanacetum coccineum]|uniref:Reverse transcriptase domain-containing protein n=1 Tax=Tanacetum coccineum TaxID=301880 RepID=A0ABQ5GYW5_9ASTR
MEFTYALRLNFMSTNNEAEYEALLASLGMAKKMNVQYIDAKVDSKLVASHINGSYMASSTSMKADIFSKLATHAFDHLTKKVLVKVLAERSTDRKEVSAIVEEEEDNWMTPIVRCLAKGVWPKDKEERRALRMKINQYVLEYTWDPAECTSGRGACSGAEAPQNHNDFNHGTMAILPMGNGHSGTLPQAFEKLKFVIIAIEYFTKWFEAKSLAKITGKDVKKFVWDNIVCRFGLSRVIVTDNGTQFVNDPFKGWCESLNIKQMNTAVAHPHANGLVERANKSLMEGIKARIGRERAGWVDELPNVLWAHRTSLKQSNGETPFSLTYGSEAVIPAEIGMPTHRTMMIREDENEDELRLNMDLLQERREAAAIREAKYKTKMEQYYNQKVRPMSFKLDEYVF